MEYNQNIILIKEANGPVELQDNEYYVLMVTDEVNRHIRKPKEYWDYKKGFVGLECTNKNIYISKTFKNRHNPSRGKTFVARIVNPSLCNELSY